MLPEIAHHTEFICANDFQAAQFAKNDVIAATLLSTIKCWNSLLRDTIDETLAGLSPWDQRAILTLPDVLNVAQPLEQRTSCHQQFSTQQATAVVRVLNYLPCATADVETFHRLRDNLANINQRLIECIEWAGMGAPHFLPGVSPADVVDSIPALCALLRGMATCCPWLGRDYPLRYVAVVRSLIVHVEHVVRHTASPIAHLAVNDRASWLKGKEALVSCQEAIVALQEAYCELRCQLSLQAATGSIEMMALIDLLQRCSITEGFFVQLEWMFVRVATVIALIDSFRSCPDKVGTALTDPFLSFALFDGSESTTASKALRVVTTEELLLAIEAFNVNEVPTPKAVLERIGLKAERQLNERSGKSRIPRAHVSRNILMCMLSFNHPRVTIVGSCPSEHLLATLAGVLPTLCSTQRLVSSRPCLAVMPEFVDNQVDSEAGYDSLATTFHTTLDLPDQVCEDNAQ